MIITVSHRPQIKNSNSLFSSMNREAANLLIRGNYLRFYLRSSYCQFFLSINYLTKHWNAIGITWYVRFCLSCISQRRDCFKIEHETMVAKIWILQCIDFCLEQSDRIRWVTIISNSMWYKPKSTIYHIYHISYILYQLMADKKSCSSFISPPNEGNKASHRSEEFSFLE